MPQSRARSTARLDGAPTAASTGIPAAAAFCTSSKLARPLTSSTRSASGSSFASRRGADELVEGVVPAHVFKEAKQPAALVEQGRGVQAAGVVEDGLRGPQRLGQPVDDGGVKAWPGRQPRAQGDAHGRQGSLAADAAAGGGVEVPPQPVEIDRHAAPQVHGDDVLAATGVGAAAAQPLDLACRRYDAFRQKEAGRQLEVVAGRAHGHGKADGIMAPATGHAKANFQRLFDRQEIGLRRQNLTVHLLNGFLDDARSLERGVGSKHDVSHGASAGSGPILLHTSCRRREKSCPSTRREAHGVRTSRPASFGS